MIRKFFSIHTNLVDRRLSSRVGSISISLAPHPSPIQTRSNSPLSCRSNRLEIPREYCNPTLQVPAPPSQHQDIAQKRQNSNYSSNLNDAVNIKMPQVSDSQEQIQDNCQNLSGSDSCQQPCEKDSCQQPCEKGSCRPTCDKDSSAHSLGKDRCSTQSCGNDSRPQSCENDSCHPVCDYDSCPKQPCDNDSSQYTSDNDSILHLAQNGSCPQISQNDTYAQLSQTDCCPLLGDNDSCPLPCDSASCPQIIDSPIENQNINLELSDVRTPAKKLPIKLSSDSLIKKQNVDTPTIGIGCRKRLNKIGALVQKPSWEETTV